jgi:hypothetical protein
MNQIKRYGIDELGFDFVAKEYLPEGQDEYHLRFKQNPATDYRPLTRSEITILTANGNRCERWDKVLVRDGLDIHLIEECTFYGLVRIGRLEPYYLEFSEFRTAVGLYRSRIVSCDIGNNVAISNVIFLSHYIIDDEVILTNINEMSVTSHSKFGNGIVKTGEDEEVRIWMELCNENGGRKVLPFDGMLAADAWMWSKYRGDEWLMNAFKAFTEKKFDQQRGYYGTVGTRTVIKNTEIIKDVKIGSDAYIKGANKLKNLTINSAPDAKAQIGEGCEMVNGIMDYGSRSFYGVKAVRFYLGAFSQLKYGARLINSYLAENSTISCCEVLNSLIFPAHEQHHNNSFLCASLLMGQTNMAAGATIGSNHNSRGADGELVAGRGFWPGLCVSIKHNSRFASFTILAKGDYPAELDIPLPFSLVSNDEHTGQLIVMPAYWPMYNMYAILRNENKFSARDKRTHKIQLLEYGFLAPDTINETISAIKLLQLYTGRAFYRENNMAGVDTDFLEKGKDLLDKKSPIVDNLTILAPEFENAERPVHIIKVQHAYEAYTRLLNYYGTSRLLEFIRLNKISSAEQLQHELPRQTHRQQWINLGGQLVPAEEMNRFLEEIKTGKINSWAQVHDFYRQQSESYNRERIAHGIYSLLEFKNITYDNLTADLLKQLIEDAIETRKWITRNIYESREKDYKNVFRNMIYDSPQEMESVLGRLEDNPFICDQNEALRTFQEQALQILQNFDRS